MGSNGPSVRAISRVGGEEEQERDDDIVVVVTGFGPFKAQFPINPSWEITASLPSSIPAFARGQPTSSSPAAPTTPGPNNPPKPHPQRIRILIHPSPIRVSYATVRALVPALWATAAAPRIDFMVHVGMAGGRDFYSVERRGHRDGYSMPDVDGVVLGDERHGGGRYEGGVGSDGKETHGEGVGKEKWVWEGCPPELETGVDLDDVWTRWRAALPNIDVRCSEDAGHYLCDFIYYSSLAHLWKSRHHHDDDDDDEQQQQHNNNNNNNINNNDTNNDNSNSNNNSSSQHIDGGDVVFLHVPVDSDDAAIGRGREVLIELIRALARSREMEGHMVGGSRGKLSERRRWRQQQ